MAKTLSKSQLAHFRDLLTEEERSLSEEQERLMERVRVYQQDGEQRDDYGNDTADAATELFEQEKNLALSEAMASRLQQVRHALQRVEEGTYGACEVCGNPINPERLEAFPSATLCIDDARQAESER